MRNYCVHEKAICESTSVGDNTKIWAFAHILPGAVIGADCNICDGVFIENDVIIGDRVTVKCGVQLWDGMTVGDDVFIGPNATFTNDPFPRSKVPRAQGARTIIHKGASIGANVTILPGLEIGRNAMIGAGSVVTSSVPPYAIATGNPARITGYVGTGSMGGQGFPMQTGNAGSGHTTQSDVRGVILHELPYIEDMRGSLTVGEFERSVPFLPKRYFLVFDVLSKEIRGEHAHRTCNQFLVCVKGSCVIVVDDGRCRCEIALDRPNLGIYIPSMVWGTQYKFSADAVLLVFASDYYDPEDYIRDYGKFETLVAENP